MSYEQTSVPVAKSQEKIRRLILDNGGTGIAFISQPPKEGFEAQITLDDKSYHIRVVATCNVKPKSNPKQTEQEERRVWRVLYHHMKAIYEAAKSGVLEFREMMLPYIVTTSGRTLSEHILPNLDKAVAGQTMKMLPGRHE